jgi:hypothetical protein
MFGNLKHINEMLKQDLSEVLSDTLYSDMKEESIEYFNRYIGNVVNNNDPDKLGRCQIRILGLFGVEVKDEDLPWFLPDFSFIGSKKGSFIVPMNGTMVNCYFMKEDIYEGFYVSSVIDLNNLPTQKDINYPDNMVFYETDDNDYFSINRKTNETTFNHSSGTKIIIKRDGSIVIDQAIGTTLQYKSNMSVVTPDSTKFGPFCALQFDTLTGLPLQGNTITKLS